MKARALRANPVLGLASTARLAALPDETRRPLIALLYELRTEARARAEVSWRRHKAPMAAYWKAVSVYAGHLARALR